MLMQCLPMGNVKLGPVWCSGCNDGKVSSHTMNQVFLLPMHAFSNNMVCRCSYACNHVGQVRPWAFGG